MSTTFSLILMYNVGLCHRPTLNSWFSSLDLLDRLVATRNFESRILALLEDSAVLMEAKNWVSADVDAVDVRVLTGPNSGGSFRPK